MEIISNQPVSQIFDKLFKFLTKLYKELKNLRYNRINLELLIISETNDD